MLQVVALLHLLLPATQILSGKHEFTLHLTSEANTDFHGRDFRLPRVQSINVSGHKFGMAPLAVGWIIWREKSHIPQCLLLESSYLRGTQSNFSLSFSRSGAPIAGQYYNFLRLGLTGYRERTHSLLDRACHLSIRLEETGYFSCLSDAHRRQIPGVCRDLCREGGQITAPVLPVVVFRLTDRVRRLYPKMQLSDVSDAMHGFRFSIPSKYLSLFYWLLPISHGFRLYSSWLGL